MEGILNVVYNIDRGTIESWEISDNGFIEGHDHKFYVDDGCMCVEVHGNSIEEIVGKLSNALDSRKMYINGRKIEISNIKTLGSLIELSKS